MSKILEADRIRIGSIDLMSGSVDPNTLVFSPVPSVGSFYYQSTGAQWTNLDGTNTGWVQTVANSSYGDGSDGPFTAPGGTTTLTRDMFYTALTVPNGATLSTGGFRIFVQGLLQVDAGGVVERMGNDASGTTGGASRAGGLLASCVAGGSGGVNGGVNGFSSLQEDRTLPGLGGAGGAGSGGGGGASGTQLSVIAANRGGTRQIVSALQGSHISPSNSVLQIGGGSGGGGGGGDGAVAGGGGGGAGGVIVIAARRILNNGSITAKGGNGVAGSAVNRGGGGGGGGGTIYLITSGYVGTAPSVVGGSKGVGGGGAGIDGQDGAPGLLVQLLG